MSKHIYKFGDRVTYTGAHQAEHRALVTMVTSCGRGVNVVWQDSGADYVSTSYSGLTPGWPVPEGSVRVRAAVVVTTDEDWGVAGARDMSDRDAEREAMDLINAGRKFGDIHFIEVDIERTTPKTYRAEVVS
ncbi:hypothetical protein H8E07_13345 [bacterium]|nr:hypothetical protein [bacterium]